MPARAPVFQPLTLPHMLGKARNRFRESWDLGVEVWQGLLPAERKALIKTGLSLLAIAVVEVVSVASLFPLIYAAVRPESVHSIPVLRSLYAWLQPAEGREFLIQLLGGVVIIFLFKEAIILWLRHRNHRRIYAVGSAIARRLLANYYHLPYEKIVRENPYRFTTVIMNLAYTYAQGILLPLLNFFSEVLILAVLALAVMLADPTLFSMLLFVVLPLLTLGMALLRRKARYLSRQTQRLHPTAYQRLHDATRHVLEIKTFGAVPFFQERFLGKHQELSETYAGTSTLAALPRHFMEMAMLIGMGVLIVKALLAADITPTFTFMGLFVAASYRMAPSINRIMNSLLLLRKNEFILQEMALFPDPQPTVTPSPLPALSLQKGLLFDRVTYAYPGVSTPVVEDVTMEWPRGSISVLIGPSGSGKTTLFRLAGGFLSPTKGTITIDGVPLDPAHIRQWHRYIGFMPAQPLFFAGSLLENLVLSHRHYDARRVREALQAVKLWDFVMEMPGGLHYDIGNEGQRLSDGQRQRLALARILYFNPEVILMDEPTAFLDRDTESHILKVFDQLRRQGKTLVIITHQASVVAMGDHVFSVQNGRVSALGKGKDVLLRPADPIAEILSWG